MKYTAEEIIKRYDQEKSDRGPWESHWQEVGNYVIPRRGDFTVQNAQGNKRGAQLLDNTALVSCELLAGALHGLLTNPNSKFFEFSTGNPDMDRDDSVRKWLQDCAERTHTLLNTSNFQTEVHELYLDLSSIGTAHMTIEEDDKFVVIFSTKHLRNVMLVENVRGYIDESYREFEWTAAQIVSVWGESGTVPEKVKDAARKNSPDKWKILHAIYPELPGGTKGPKPYVSQYVVRQEKAIVSEGGFNSYPAVSPRWAKASGETYGRGPGMTALPEAKMINKMTETTLIGAQKAVDPPLQAPDDGFNTQFVTRPGGISYYRAGSADRIQPIFNDTRIDFGFQALETRRARIKEAFYTNLFQTQMGPQKTAQEVMQIAEEQARLLGPMLGRQQAEFLGPLIDRVFTIAQKRGYYADPPEKLKGKPISARYSSMVAKAQRISDGNNMMRVVQAIAPFVQADQTIMDNVDGDQVFREVSEIYGFPQRAIKDKKMVEQTRQARAQAQQEALKAHQQAQQADTLAKVSPAIQQQQANVRNG